MAPTALLVPPDAALLNCTPRSLYGKFRPQNSCCLQSWLSWAAPLNCTPWSAWEKSGPRTHATRRLGCPVLAALQHYPPGAHAWKDLVPPHLQELPWLQVAQHQQASLRALTACRLGSSIPAAAARAPGSPHPNSSRPQGLCCLVGTTCFRPTGFAAPRASSTCYSVPRASHHTSKQTPGFAILLAPGGFPPHRAQRPSLPTVPTVPDSKRALTPC
jgi:hypothetical protein